MICYRDITFCGCDPCTCGQAPTKEDWENAKKIGLPIALAEFCKENNEPNHLEEIK